MKKIISKINSYYKLCFGQALEAPIGIHEYHDPSGAGSADQAWYRNELESLNLLNKPKPTDKKVSLFLKKNGILESKYLGGGLISSAYEILLSVNPEWQYKVAKVSQSKNEIDRMYELESFKLKMPEKFHKHFIKIYDRFETPGFSLYGIVVENLEELPKELEKLLFPARSFREVPYPIQYRETRESIKKKELDLINELYRYVSSNQFNIDFMKNIKASSRFTSEMEEFITLFLNRLRLFNVDIYNIKQNSIRNNDSTIDFINDLVSESFLKKIISGILPDDNDIKIDLNTIKDLIVDTIMNVLDYYEYNLKNTMLPINESIYNQRKSSKNLHEILGRYSEGSEFLEFLDELSKIGVKFGDIKDGNLMMRKSDNAIVIIDAGMFRFGNTTDSIPHQPEISNINKERRSIDPEATIV